MAAQDINGTAHNGATNGHHTPSTHQNGYPNGNTIVDQGNELANRFSGMLSSHIKSTMDYASVKAAETRTFVEKKVNGAVDLGHDIAKKADEIPVVHETTHYFTFLIHTAVSTVVGATNFVKNVASSTITTVKTAVRGTTEKATEAVKSSVSTYRQMAQEKAKQVMSLGASLAQKYLPRPVYDLGCKFMDDPVATTREQLPPKVVELGDKAADVGKKYYDIAKDVTGKTKSNIDAVRSEALKKAGEAKKVAESNLNWGMQSIGLSKKNKEE